MIHPQTMPAIPRPTAYPLLFSRSGRGNESIVLGTCRLAHYGGQEITLQTA